MKNKMTCYIFGAGEYYGDPPALSDADFVIAADGGYDYLLRHGLRADLVIGDFDSLSEPPKHDNVRVLPMEKDDTDMRAAIQTGLNYGCGIFHICGGTGGRLDHTLANIQCLAELAGRGARGFLHGRDTVITAIQNAKISFSRGNFGTISVFSHSDISLGVYENGLKYPLSDATLHNTYPLGISNEFCSAPASIEVRSGTLIIIYPKNTQEDNQ